ncbi:MAG: hypothetical protein ACPGVB_17605, partial [Chitinophagales bacterium]
DTSTNNFYYANIYAQEVTGVGTYENVGGYFGSENQENFYQMETGTMEITQYGENSGDIIRGTFTGEAFGGQNGVTIVTNVSGLFKAIRQ